MNTPNCTYLPSRELAVGDEVEWIGNGYIGLARILAINTGVAFLRFSTHERPTMLPVESLRLLWRPRS